MAEQVRGFWGSTRGKLLILALVVLALLIGSAFVAARFTESNRFCGSDCHEMWPYRDTWEASTHSDVDCVRCHIPPGAVNFALTKLYASREVWVHFSGQVKAPIAVTRRIPNVVCTNCHPPGEIAQPIPLVGTSFDHAAHSGEKCVDCHDQVVHHPLPGVPYIPPQSMIKCFTCHDGKRAPGDCSYCHKPPHIDRGPCERCHNVRSWVPGAFDHPVPLSGPHAQILCEQCHTQTSGNSMGFPAGCVSCHGNHHNDPKMTECARCHTTTHFVPATFAHPQEGPHVPVGEEPLPCQACHTKGFGTASCPCHGGNPPGGD